MIEKEAVAAFRPSAVRDEFYLAIQNEYAKRYPSYDTASMQIMYNFSQVHGRCEAWLHGCLVENGMTFPSLNLLVILRSFGSRGCALNRLSELQLVSRANITGIIDHLEKKKYVIRHAHETDRRVVLAKITPDGEQWLDNYLPGHYARIREMLSTLDEKEKKQLIALLRKLRQADAGKAKTGKAQRL